MIFLYRKREILIRSTEQHPRNIDEYPSLVAKGLTAVITYATSPSREEIPSKSEKDLNRYLEDLENRSSHLVNNTFTIKEDQNLYNQFYLRKV